MDLPQFIRIEKTNINAMNYRSNPDMQFFYFGGVQVLPGIIIRQRTNVRTGISLPSIFAIEVVDMCGDVITQLSQSEFKVEQNITDQNGWNQFDWSLRTNFDAGYKLVQLRLGFRESDNLTNTTYYTNPFYITSELGKFTTRWLYRNSVEDNYLCISLQMHYLQDDDAEELSTYDRKSSGKRVTLTNELTAIEIWRTRPIDIRLFGLIKRMIACRFVYSTDEAGDIVFYRTSKNETFETPRLEGKENHAQQEMILVRDKDDAFTLRLSDIQVLWSSTQVLISDTGYKYSRNNP